MPRSVQLEPDVAEAIQIRMKAEGLTLQAAVNKYVRKGLADPKPKRRAFKVKARDFGFPPALNDVNFSRLAEALEDQAIIAKMRRA